MKHKAIMRARKAVTSTGFRMDFFLMTVSFSCCLSMTDWRLSHLDL